MKKISGILLMGLFGLMATASAQEHDHHIKQSIKTGAQKTGAKTAEIASKGKSKITDEKYKDKVGPNNETIYIDNHSRYYWVDKKGRRHYVNAAQLKARTK